MDAESTCFEPKFSGCYKLRDSLGLFLKLQKIIAYGRWESLEINENLWILDDPSFSLFKAIKFRIEQWSLILADFEITS